MTALHKVCATAHKVHDIVTSYLHIHRRPGRQTPLKDLRTKLSTRTVIAGPLVARFTVDPDTLTGLAVVRCLRVPRAELVLPVPFNVATIRDRWTAAINAMIRADLRATPVPDIGSLYDWDLAGEADKPAIFEALVDRILEAEEADYQNILDRYAPALAIGA